MIFHYGDRFQQYFEDGTSIIQPASFVFGQITKFIEISPTGVSGIVAARFFPDGLAPFLPVPIVALENKAVPVADLFGEEGKLTEERIFSAISLHERVKIIEEFLLSRLRSPQTIDSITKSCIVEIFQSHGQLGMAELAGKMNITRRNLERRFSSVIGMSPKQLSKVIRLQATLKMLQQKQFTSLTSLAYENGYYDQAHFIKDFKDFTGISPKLFFAENLQLSNLFALAD
jgi:AraC-like DNA-binding protein